MDDWPDLFQRSPEIALYPAVGALTLFVMVAMIAKGKRLAGLSWLIPAVLWYAYDEWEQATGPGIRVDLLLIYPVLVISTVGALIETCRQLFLVDGQVNQASDDRPPDQK